MVCKYLFPFSKLPFNLDDVFLYCAKAIHFDLVLYVFACGFFAFEVRSIKTIRPASRKLLPLFSSRDFLVSGLIFKSLIHFELIFVFRKR